MRSLVLTEVLKMAWNSLRAHKMRSLLTVLGIVIGIMMVVGMTSLIRGFDKSITGQIESMGSDTLYLVKWSGTGVLAGGDLRELLARPDIDDRDAEAIERLSETVGGVSVMYGASFPPAIGALSYRGERSNQTQVMGVAPAFLDAGDMELDLGRFVTSIDVRNRSDVVVIGNGVRKALFPTIDPINRRIRINGREYRVVGTIKERAAASMLGDQADNFAIVPSGNFRKLFGARPDAMIILRAKNGIPVEDMQRDVEGIMRARHGLRADQPSDFELSSQETLLELWNNLTQYFFLTLVALSSVALMVGGIGVMAIMLVSVTERTREIGIRKALGARSSDVLIQFLAEAVVLAAVGGLMGAGVGASVGWIAHKATGFPISLPWWSFAIAVGTSSLIGIVSGIYPANRAARLDPVEALRYE
ncbi:MAG: FtsX-like permease family protein [Acidobacteria bacterium]|nr:FtsX-like permease family protein [Acidobacteriota bacterium]